MRAKAQHAVLNARVSDPKQEREGWSLPAQMDRLREYAGRHELQVVREFVSQESAKEPGRLDFNEMVAWVRRQKEPHALLFEDVDRSSRNAWDSLTIEQLRREGHEIHATRSGLVLHRDSPPTDVTMWRMQEVWAQHYIAELSQKIRGGMQRAAKDGNWPHRAHLGYRNRRDARGRAYIEPDPERSEWIRSLFDWYAVGDCTIKDLVPRADAAGMRGTRGAKLRASTINAILREPAYAGEVLWCGELRPASFEPIVERATWDRVQDLLDSRINQRRGPARTVYLFTGLITCGHCGCGVGAHNVRSKSGKRYIYYRCSWSKGRCPERMMPEKRVDAQIRSLLEQLRFPAYVIDELRDAIGNATATRRRETEHALGRLQAQQAKLERRLDKVLEAFLDEQLPPDLYERKSTEWRQEIERLSGQIDAHRRADWSMMDDGLALLELTRRAPELWDQANKRQKRRIVTLVHSNTQIRDGRVTADFLQPFADVVLAAKEERQLIAAESGTPVLVDQSGRNPKNGSSAERFWSALASCQEAAENGVLEQLMADAA